MSNIVTYEEALQLKAGGFSKSCEFYYILDGTRKPCNSRNIENHNTYPYKLSAPEKSEYEAFNKRK